MISKALLHLLSASYASAYFAEANNAHLEFVATGTTSETAAASSDTTVFTVDSNSLKHHPSQLKALEDALAAQPPSLGFSAPHILDLFEGWMKRFKKEYETAEEKMERLLIFLQNHGEYIMCHVMCFIIHYLSAIFIHSIKHYFALIYSSSHTIYDRHSCY